MVAMAVALLSSIMATAVSGRMLAQLSATSLLPGGASGGADLTVLQPDEVLQPLDPRCATYNYTRYVRVNTTMDLIAALNSAQPGDLVELAPNTAFQPTVVDSNAPGGRWNVTITGKIATADSPIVVCGASTAVIDGTDFWNVNTDTFGNVHGIAIVNSSYVQLVGFSIVKGGLTGVTISGTDHSVLDGLTITTVLSSAVRIRNVSTYNIVENCVISDTGHRDVGIGEGVYIGTTPNPAVPPSMSDASNYNQVLNNQFSHVTAEMVDAKANTQGGIISGNYYDGTYLSGVNGAKTCISIKGGPYTITDNTCVNMPHF